MLKATVLYGHPASPESFEKYYSETHLPLAAKTQGLVKLELTKFLANPDTSAPAYYRMAELYFEGSVEMQQVLISPEGIAMATNLTNFATGGVTKVFGTTDK